MKTHGLFKSGIIIVITMLFLISCEESINEQQDFAVLKAAKVKYVSNFVPSLPTSYCGSIVDFDLIGGQTIHMGIVQLVNDEEHLYIKFIADPGYGIAETHVYIGDIEEMKTGGNGNPKIGSFPYKYEGEVQPEVIHEIDLEEIGSQCFDIAAHAVVRCISGECATCEETAWAKDQLVFAVKAKFNTSNEIPPYSVSGNWLWGTTQEFDITPECSYNMGYHVLNLESLQEDFDLYDFHTTPIDEEIIGNVHIEKDADYLIFTISGSEFNNIILYSYLYVGNQRDLFETISGDCFDFKSLFPYGTPQNYYAEPGPHQYIVEIPAVDNLGSSRWGFYIKDYCLSSCSDD